jgi:hypothetical protein
MYQEVDNVRLSELMALRPEIPTGHCGDVEVTKEDHPPGSELTVVSMRNAIMMGWKPTRMTFPDGVTIRELKYEGGTWMSDSPQEVWQMNEPLQAMKGHVLVGGLGLGVFPSLAYLEPGVSQVTVVEKDPRVIQLIHQWINIKIEVVLDDIYNYVEKADLSQFDTVFMDTWQGTGETVWATEVVPLLRALYKNAVWEDKAVYVWNQREMEGQLIRSLPNVCCTDGLKCNGVMGFYEVFARVASKERVVLEAVHKNELHDPAMIQLREEMAAHLAEDSEFNDLLYKFLDVGGEWADGSDWESLFGETWDEVYANVDVNAEVE